MGIINKIYKFYGPNQSGYLYSEQNTPDKMKYSYHMIIMKKGVPIVLDAGNTIKVLQQGDIRLEPFNKNGAEYELFIKLISIAEKCNVIPLQNNNYHLKQSHRMESPYKHAK